MIYYNHYKVSSKLDTLWYVGKPEVSDLVLEISMGQKQYRFPKLYSSARVNYNVNMLTITLLVKMYYIMIHWMPRVFKSFTVLIRGNFINMAFLLLTWKTF